MNPDLTDEETAALLRELDGLIDGDRYFLSERIKTLSRPSRNQRGDFTHANPSAVRAILDDPPIHIRPDVPAARVQSEQTLWVYAIPAHL